MSTFKPGSILMAPSVTSRAPSSSRVGVAPASLPASMLPAVGANDIPAVGAYDTTDVDGVDEVAVVTPKGPNFLPPDDLRFAQCYVMQSRQGPNQKHLWREIKCLYDDRADLPRSRESLKSRFGAISRGAQKYNCVRKIVVTTIPSGDILDEAEVREETQKLYRRTNKVSQKGVMHLAPVIHYVETCLFLKDCTKYGGVRKQSASKNHSPSVPASMSASASASGAATSPPGGTASSTGDDESNSDVASAEDSKRSLKDAAVAKYARPMVIKKQRKQQVAENKRMSIAKVAASVDGLSSAMRDSASKRAESANLMLRMSLIAKAFSSDADRTVAYHNLMAEVSVPAQGSATSDSGSGEDARERTYSNDIGI